MYDEDELSFVSRQSRAESEDEAESARTEEQNNFVETRRAWLLSRNGKWGDQQDEETVGEQAVSKKEESIGQEGERLSRKDRKYYLESPERRTRVESKERRSPPQQR